jgi:ribosome-binding protein aMBF1 (putative translation factor)
MSKNPINYQDWEPVVLSKKKDNEKKEFIQKPVGNKELNRLLDEDIPKLNKISREYAQAIIDGRNALGITQKDLANKMSVRENVIKEYENLSVINFNMGFYKKILRNLKIDPKDIISKNN